MGECGNHDGIGEGLSCDVGAAGTSASLKETEARMTIRDVLNWGKEARQSLMWAASRRGCLVGKAAPYG